MRGIQVFDLLVVKFLTCCASNVIQVWLNQGMRIEHVQIQVNCPSDPQEIGITSWNRIFVN